MSCIRTVGYICIIILEKYWRMFYGKTVQWKQYDGSGNVLLRNIGFYYSCRKYFVTYHLSQNHWIPLQCNSLLWWHWHCSSEHCKKAYCMSWIGIVSGTWHLHCVALISLLLMCLTNDIHSTEPPPCNLWLLKNILLTFLHQIPDKDFRSFVPDQVKVVSWAHGKPISY